MFRPNPFTHHNITKKGCNGYSGLLLFTEFVLERAEKKNWKSAVRSTVTAAMANIICENRDLMKLEDDKA